MKNILSKLLTAGGRRWDCGENISHRSHYTQCRFQYILRATWFHYRPHLTIIIAHIINTHNWGGLAMIKKKKEVKNVVVPDQDTPAASWFSPCNLGLQHTDLLPWHLHLDHHTGVVLGFCTYLPSRISAHFVSIACNIIKQWITNPGLHHLTSINHYNDVIVYMRDFL